MRMYTLEPWAKNFEGLIIFTISSTKCITVLIYEVQEVQTQSTWH